MRFIAAGVLMLVVGGTSTIGQGRAAAKPPSAVDILEAGSFLNDLQGAVGRRDAPAVAALVQYPLTVLASPFTIPVPDAAAFVKGFDAFLTPELSAVVALAGVPQAEKPAPIYPVAINADGMTIGGRAIWVRRVGARFRIARIVPLPNWSGGPSARDPFRVRFAAGSGSARFSGTLVRYQVASYLVTLAKGETLQASLYGGGERDVILRVVDAQNGIPLDDRAKQGTRLWTGPAPQSGDYRVDVIGITAENGPAVKYMLAINLR